MKKLVSVIVSGVIGSALAVFAAFGVADTSTAAPDKNPASTQVVDYGSSK